jgi:isopentenyldiphosphate isomerase
MRNEAQSMQDASREIVDVVDENNQTVRIVTRAELRASGLPHRCTYILVFDQAGQLFIHQRTPTKDVFPSYWDVTVGGVLAAGEPYDDGARREAHEELGIDSARLVRLFPFRYIDNRTDVHGMVYKLVHDGPFRLQPEEIIRGEFVAIDSVHDRAARVPFCPDGLAVLREFQRQTITATGST